MGTQNSALPQAATGCTGAFGAPPTQRGEMSVTWRKRTQSSTAVSHAAFRKETLNGFYTPEKKPASLKLNDNNVTQNYHFSPP